MNLLSSDFHRNKVGEFFSKCFYTPTNQNYTPENKRNGGIYVLFAFTSKSKSMDNCNGKST